MTKTFRRIILAALAFILIAGLLCAFVLLSSRSSTANDPLADTKNGFVNSVIDASGIKGQIDSELRTRAGEIAAQYGISQSAVDDIADSLAINDWKVTSLPESASETGTFSIDAAGTATQVTTYDDPSVVTVNAYGQSITMEVPESAQVYVPYLQYLQYLQQ